MPASDALRSSLEAVMREAGEVALVTSRGPFRKWHKGPDRSPVSEGDIAVNDLLRDKLPKLVPGAAWLSEENEDLPDSALKQAWIVDPIDGTRAYISGRPDWTISVALVEDGRPVLAALYAPATEEMFLAQRGRATTLNGTTIRPDAGGTLTGARMAGPKRYMEKLESIVPTMLAQPKIHSLALRLTRVAQGELDAAFSSGGSHDWDLAAADLLVHEAGGLLTDFNGQPLRFNRAREVHGALIAAGPARHGALLELVRDRMPEFA